MATDYKQLMKDVSKQVGALKKDQPDTISGFYAMAGAATKDGVLDEKTKELITLAVAVAMRCEPCIAFHMKGLMRLGVTKEEVEETLGCAIYMGGGPALMYAGHALEAFDQLSD